MNNKFDVGRLINLPNLLSLSRLILLPLILFLIVTHQNIVALVFMLISWVTDALDGYLARKTNQVTNVGKILDHFVDKIWIGTILVTLAITHNLPLWIAGIVILRDLLITMGSIHIIRKKSYIYSSPVIGKITGFFFAVMIVTFLLDFTYLPIIRNAVLVIVITLIITSLGYYLYRYLKALK